MNATFLIGNGFDINCGIRCTFREICEEYCKTASSSETIKSFKVIIDKDIDTWADFEISMNQFLSNFQTEEEALECIRDFKIYMKDFLKKEEAIFLRKYKKHDNDTIRNAIKEEMRNSIHSFFKGISKNIESIFQGNLYVNNSNFRFITFNYTRIFDSLIEAADSTSSIIHIHGNLDDETVLGIDNEAQLNSNLQFEPTRKLRREFIKPVFNNMYDTNRITIANSFISNCDVICVFGMSLGDSDLTWRNSILKWIKAEPSHHLFLYQYSCANIKYLTIPHRMEIEDAAKEAFYDRIRLDNTTRAAIDQQIHIPIGRNIFNILNVMIEGEKKQSEQEKKIKEQSEDARQRSTGSVLGA